MQHVQALLLVHGPRMQNVERTTCPRCLRVMNCSHGQRETRPACAAWSRDTTETMHRQMCVNPPPLPPPWLPAGISANARQCLRNVVENLKARRLVEDRLGAEATVAYLGQLPSAPPDYFYRIKAREN